MSARILIVDDNPLNVKLLAARLSREYYVVDSATDGPSALEKAARTLPDIILLDVMMPEMDGFEVCTRLKADPVTHAIPVVMVTALSDSADKVRGLEAGADDFLSKPINEVALLARVRSLLRTKFMMDEWNLRERISIQFGGIPAIPDQATVENTQPPQILLVGFDESESEQILGALSNIRAATQSVPDPAAAMAALGGQLCDLVIGNLPIGRDDGLVLCSQLRSVEITRQIPILLAASEDDLVRVARGLELGANDYILRPIDGNELLARVRAQLRYIRYYNRLRENYERNLAMALTDPLTCAFNRRYLDIQLPRLFDRAAAGKRSLSALMIDIDHFKSINDRFGHPVGDEVLKELVARCNRNLRSFDLVVRMGGEEFAVIMPETDLSIATMIAQRLCARVADPGFLPGGGESKTLPVTISIGVAAIYPENDSPDKLLKRADDALYRAKQAGRNRVEMQVQAA